MQNFNLIKPFNSSLSYLKSPLYQNNYRTAYLFVESSYEVIKSYDHVYKDIKIIINAPRI